MAPSSHQKRNEAFAGHVFIACTVDRIRPLRHCSSFCLLPKLIWGF